MEPQSVILIFDVGKTNKKTILFDEQYRIVFEASVQFEEITDEDGFPCENVQALTAWIENSVTEILADKRFNICAINFSAYGASFVYVDKDLKPVLPLYNYLKPFPEILKKQFYKTYGGENYFSRITASPVLGNLNSGMQLYRLKHERPEDFKKIKYALHLPQYLSSILTKQPYSEITSIGCHTNLWNFSTNDYHEWVYKEGIITTFPPTLPSNECLRVNLKNRTCCVGIGLHDSSAALIPYLANFHEPFILLSTGTWCISLNPFNHTELTKQELENDSLCYLTYQGNPVKASRLFAGYEHEQHVRTLAARHHVSIDYFTTLDYDSARAKQINDTMKNKAGRKTRDDEYYTLITDIVTKQLQSTKLVSGDNAKRIFVDGGFSKNRIYMHTMAAAFRSFEVYAASVAQASSLGAALAIHQHWNKRPLPSDLIELKFYS